VHLNRRSDDFSRQRILFYDIRCLDLSSCSRAVFSVPLWFTSPVRIFDYVPLAVTAATANPVGLIVGGAVKVGGEVTGEDTIKGAAKRTATAISGQLRVKFQEQGWI
jgi:hypothetical protein